MPDFGDGSAREDYGSVDINAPSVANGQITPDQWAEYQRKRKRDAVLGVLATLGATTGLGLAGQAFGGAAANAAGGPGFGVGAANTGTWTSSVGAAPSVGAGVATGAATGAGVGAGAATGAANTIAGTAGKTAGGIFGGMSGTDLAALVAALGGTIGGAMSQPTDITPTSATTDPAMREVLDLMRGRLKKSEPMYDSALAMANGLLPTAYQNGGRGA